ncbi:MAG: hypothetical protein J3K34DRAFT_235196 [Monoraphidium minutum]|nr:MAG: hypothetical protein J3K34DRAFT_235196 [Monoraphidium minutum]
MARIEMDNKVAEVQKSLAKIKKEVAKELCGVPEKDVTIWKVMDDSTKVMGIGDTQTLVYAACKAPLNKLEDVLDDCEDMWNRHQTKDELQDSTSWFSGGEVKVDDVDCNYVVDNKFQLFSGADAGRAKAAGVGAAPEAAATAAATGPAIGAAGAAAFAPKLVAALAGAAAAAAALL